MTTQGTIVITFPMPPRLTNSERGRSRHWRSLNREKRDYQTQLDLLLNARQLPPPPSVPFPHVRISSVMTLGGEMDDDNAMARHKWILDWLVKRGYLEGDRRKQITWTGMPDQIVTRSEAANVRLTIEPVSV